MATSKVQVPQPAIFNSDPEEQIYARGVLSEQPGSSGLAYMFKNAADMRRGQNQDRYMQGVSEANRIAAALAQQENQQAMLIEAMKLIPDFAKAGVPIAQFPALAGTSATGGTDEQTANASLLVNLLKQADISQKQAQAAAAGQEGADQYTYELDTTAQGPAQGTWKGKGKDPNRIEAELYRRAMNDKNARLKGGALAPNPVEKFGGGTQEYDPNRKKDRNR